MAQTQRCYCNIFRLRRMVCREGSRRKSQGCSVARVVWALAIRIQCLGTCGGGSWGQERGDPLKSPHRQWPRAPLVGPRGRRPRPRRLRGRAAARLPSGVRLAWGAPDSSWVSWWGAGVRSRQQALRRASGFRCCPSVGCSSSAGAEARSYWKAFPKTAHPGRERRGAARAQRLRSSGLGVSGALQLRLRNPRLRAHSRERGCKVAPRPAHSRLEDLMIFK